MFSENFQSLKKCCFKLILNKTRSLLFHLIAIKQLFVKTGTITSDKRESFTNFLPHNNGVSKILFLRVAQLHIALQKNSYYKISI